MSPLAVSALRLLKNCVSVDLWFIVLLSINHKDTEAQRIDGIATASVGAGFFRRLFFQPLLQVPKPINPIFIFLNSFPAEPFFYLSTLMLAGQPAASVSRSRTIYLAVFPLRRYY
jgi:hypothetical protein